LGDFTVKNLVWKRVNANVGGIADPHVGQLGLFVVGLYPDVAPDQIDHMGSIAVRSARWDSGNSFKATAILENIGRLDRNRLGFYRMSQLNKSLLHVSGSARPE
jgi:hypothetical protein